MLRLKALGGLALLCEKAAPHGAATQRRRLTLLAIIAIAGKKGVSRDRLLTLLWPESGKTQGRHGLAQSLYALKRDLQTDELFLGTSELRLNPDVITCDVEDFREALMAGDTERAIELYQGPLLDGVYISGAPDFERWLDSERDSLCRSNSEALEKLAIRQQKNGDNAAAAVTWTRLSAADALNTRITIHAMQSLVAAGNVAAALNHARLHESQRREELELPADPEVVAFRNLIAKTERDCSEAAEAAVAAFSENSAGREIEPVPGMSTLKAIAVPLSPPTSPTVASLPIQLNKRKRVALYWLGAAATVAVIASLVGQAVVSADTGKLSEHRVAVLPFTVRGNARLAWLGDGIVDLLSQRLDGVGPIHTVDPNALLTFIDKSGDEHEELALGKIAAQHFAAGQFVVGSIVDAGGKIQVSATAYDANGKRLAVVSASAADEAHILSLVDDLARGLVGSELRNTEAQLGSEAAYTTQSIPALKAFLEGEQDFRAAHFPAAVESYQRAVAADSTFALAWYRLSTASEWSSHSEVIRNATRLAVRFESRLPRQERMLLDARMAALRGNDDEVERMYKTILVSHPEDAEAWNQLGETVFHNGGWRGRPIAESRSAFERVASLQASDVSSRLHLVRLAALRNDRTSLDTLIPEALSRTREPDQALELNAFGALASGDRIGSERFLDSLQHQSGSVSLSDESVRLAAWRVATFNTDPRSAQKLILMLARNRNSPTMRLSGLLGAAHMAAAQGKWIQSRTFLDMANGIDHAASVRTRANLLSSGIGPAANAETRMSLNALESLPQAAEQSALGSLLIDASLRGRLAVSLGDIAATRRSGIALASLVRQDSTLASIGRHFRFEIEARAAEKRGDAKSALSTVEAGWPAKNPQSSYPWLQSEAYTMAADRFLRASLLEQSGRLEEALPWYETIVEDQGFGTIYLAPAYLRRAIIEEKSGRRAAAAEHYHRFISLWRDADPPLQPQVRYALARLNLLAGKK